MRGQLAQATILERVDLGRFRRRRGDHRQGTVGAWRRTRDDATAFGQPLDAAARRRHSSDVLRAIVDDHKRQRSTIGRPRRAADRSIQRVGENPRLTAGGRNHRQPGLIVRGVLHLVAKLIADRPPIRAPTEHPALFGSRRGQPPGLGAGTCVDDEHVRVRHLVHVPVVSMATNECDLPAVGRPGWRGLVERAWRQDLGFGLSRISEIRGNVEEIQVAALAAEVPASVRLEVVAIDDNWLWCLRRRVFALVVFFGS